jgi:hypothetical protein
MSRAAHWVRENHQERMPPRMVAFDTEARSRYDDTGEVQEWRVGCAIRWRTDTKSSDHRESRVFDSPEDFWSWVSDYTRKGTRTVVWAHNLGYDVRVSRMFEILPQLGYHLEWCNLDRNISSATWRSDHGSIVLADTWTWIPLPLGVIAGQTGTIKYDMPHTNADYTEWARYCMRDTEILYRVCRVLVAFIKAEGLGNWQPTGAGMAMATWRHKFMEHKVLVHDNVDALQAERIAMHTGRAEAWRHGKIHGEKWTEVDLKNAYVTIAATHDLPRKIHMHHGTMSLAQYRKLQSTFAVLCRVAVDTRVPCIPHKTPDKHLWPVGKFETWLWDSEVDLAYKHAESVKILEAYSYVRAPILRQWAEWVLRILQSDQWEGSPVVRTHVKHCGRALIGRIALRVPSWEYFGDNPEGITGITHVTFPEEKRTTRMLHVGHDTLIEKSREEGKDSLPMITGYIMSVCRVMLWEAMEVAGFGNLAHVDTDSCLVNTSALAAMRAAYSDRFHSTWAIKGTYTDLEIYGPRAYYRDSQRVTAGIPAKAEETSPGRFEGVKWSAVASDLERGQVGTVTLSPAQWNLRRTDPRRADVCGDLGFTRPYDVAEL